MDFGTTKGHELVKLLTPLTTAIYLSDLREDELAQFQTLEIIRDCRLPTHLTYLCLHNMPCTAGIVNNKGSHFLPKLYFH